MNYVIDAITIVGWCVVFTYVLARVLDVVMNWIERKIQQIIGG